MWPMRRADNLTTFMCRMSWNLEASTSWNAQSLSRSVKRLLYLRVKCICRYLVNRCSLNISDVKSYAFWSFWMMKFTLHWIVDLNFFKLVFVCKLILCAPWSSAKSQQWTVFYRGDGTTVNVFPPCTAPTMAARVRVTRMEVIPPFLASHYYCIVAIAVC
jgi:hypothetical protein